MDPWQTINFEITDIVSETQKAYLIQLPDYVSKNLDVKNGTTFWFPRKLVKGERGQMIASFPPDFTIHLFHSTRDAETGRYTKKGEEQVSAATLVEQWVTQENQIAGPGVVEYDEWN